MKTHFFHLIYTINFKLNQLNHSTDKNILNFSYTLLSTSQFLFNSKKKSKINSSSQNFNNQSTIQPNTCNARSVTHTPLHCTHLPLRSRRKKFKNPKNPLSPQGQIAARWAEIAETIKKQSLKARRPRFN